MEIKRKGRPLNTIIVNKITKTNDAEVVKKSASVVARRLPDTDTAPKGKTPTDVKLTSGAPSSGAEEFSESKHDGHDEDPELATVGSVRQDQRKEPIGVDDTHKLLTHPRDHYQHSYTPHSRSGQK